MNKLSKYLAPDWFTELVSVLSDKLSDSTYEVEFYKTLPVLTDYKKLELDFKIVVLKSSMNSLNNVKFDIEKYPYVLIAVNGSKAAVIEMIRCLKAGEDTTAAQSAAASAAWSAAASAAEWKYFGKELRRLIRKRG